MSNEKKHYVMPKNIAFIMGPSFITNNKIIHTFADLYNDNDQYIFLDDEDFFAQTVATTLLDEPEPEELFKLGVSICNGYAFRLVDMCELARDNPDQLVLTAVCPFDAFILFHTWDQLEWISKDSHYLLCSMLSNIISPWSMTDYNVTMLYPDLYTVLKDEPEETTTFFEQFHLMYHAYFLNNIASHLKSCKVIEDSKMNKRMSKLLKHINDLYEKNTTKSPTIENLPIHPALNNERILVDEDKELQEIQKAFDAKKEEAKESK